MRAAGKKHNVPEATIRHKISGYHPVSMKIGPPTLLTSAEESVLMNYIRGERQRAHPVTKNNVISAVTCILDDEVQAGIIRARPPSFEGYEPKRKWWRLFRARHPTLVFRTPEPLTSSRRSISKNNIKQWFESVDQGNLYNFI